jgi:hypothetical protein
MSMPEQHLNEFNIIINILKTLYRECAVRFQKICRQITGVIRWFYHVNGRLCGDMAFYINISYRQTPEVQEGIRSHLKLKILVQNQGGAEF